MKIKYIPLRLSRIPWITEATMSYRTKNVFVKFENSNNLVRHAESQLTLICSIVRTNSRTRGLNTKIVVDCSLSRRRVSNFSAARQPIRLYKTFDTAEKKHSDTDMDNHALRSCAFIY